MSRAMRGFLLGVWLLGTSAAAASGGAPVAVATTGASTAAATAMHTDVPRLDANSPTARLELPVGSDHAQGITRCELCHSVASWSDAKFDHDRTGFPLVGAHQQTGCRDCHVKDLQTTVARTCAGCHRDAHKGELGQHCESCHTPKSWESLFGADAHRRTNFPLQGRHAAIPCSECHGEVRDNVFTRTTTPCVGCHEQQYLSTGSGAVNHLTFGFSTQCRECHNAFRFRPARFAAHERCFSLSGPHAGIGCLTCHRSLQGAIANGTCSTNTAACSSCHAHVCSRMDSVHRDVAGYACEDLKCYECHSLTGGGE